MRVGLEVVAVLEGAGLALVGVDRHQARRRLVRARSRHLRPVGKPAPPSPRSPESSSVSITSVDGRARRRGSRRAAGSRRRRGRRRSRGSPAARGCVSPAATAAATLSTVACSCSAWPIAATGALWQPPMQGARTTRTLGRRAGRAAPPSSCSRADQRAGQAVADPHRERRRRRLAVHARCRNGRRTRRPRRPRPAPAASPRPAPPDGRACRQP